MAHHGVADRYRILNKLWVKLKPLLPERRFPHRFGGGRPRANNRARMDATFF